MNKLAIVTLLAVVFGSTAARAEDTKAKVGNFTTEIVWERTSEGFVIENTVNCTRTARKVTCHSYDAQGWVDTTVCTSRGCRTVASR